MTELLILGIYLSSMLFGAAALILQALGKDGLALKSKKIMWFHGFLCVANLLWVLFS